MSETIEQARARFLPADGIKVLFIAEAPPADPTRYFYFEHVQVHDWLYLGLTRALYEDARELDVKDLRKRKSEYLRRFQSDGYYLIDAYDGPLPPHAKHAAKKSLLKGSLPALVGKVRRLAGADTRVALISKSVHAVCCEPLKADGVNVVNTEMIDFPASSRQPHFDRKLRRALDEFLHSVIRGLEESVRFFSAGKAQQKERDRWVVEHFLQGLGLTFDAAEIEQPDNDPPDAMFRGAEFEVKEIQKRGRRRGDDYKRELKKAKAAASFDELLEHFTPEDISIAEIYRRIMEETQDLAAQKYQVEAVRHSLDLLFYLNLGMATAWTIDDGERPDFEPLINEGWRSVSFLHGTSTVCVIRADDSAPEFLKCDQGRLIVRRTSE